MENLIYWNGMAVGMECDGRVTWFPTAPRAAIAALGG